MNLTLRQLNIFQSVASHLSYTRAAQELFLTQPAVSIQVKQLEESVGLPLFEQLGKKIYLTEAGRELHNYSKIISQQLNEYSTVVDNLKGMSKGKLIISVATTANYFIPTLLGNFCQRFPGVTVNLDVTNRKVLLRKLRDNETDLVVMGQPPELMDLEAHSFLQNPLIIVASPNSELSQIKDVPLKKLENEVFLIREKGSGTRDAMERFFKHENINIKIGMEISSNEAIKQSVQAGLGLGLLSIFTIEMELKLQRLIVLDIKKFPIMRHWYIVHRKGKRLSVVAQAFKEFLLSEAKTSLIDFNSFLH